MNVYHLSKFHYDVFTPDHWANLLWLLAPETQNNNDSKFEPLDLSPLYQYLADHEAQLRPRLNSALASPSLRLGKYCEQLLSFAFSVCEKYVLHCSGLQISEAGRTLGELDYVLSGPRLDTVHMEMAVKFYLRLPTGELVGPALKDSLRQKESHLTKVQLPMSLRAAAVSLLEERGVAIKERRVFMPMRLFEPYNQGSLDRTWMPICEFIELKDRDWYPVPRLCWPGAYQLDVASAPKVDVVARFMDGGSRPLMLTNSLGELIFLVADDWLLEAVKFVEVEKQGES